MKKMTLLAFCAVLGCLGIVFGESVSEYSVKAAYLFNFAKFVEWPPKTFSDAKAPFLIGILGEDPFGDILDHTVEGKAVDGHLVQVRRFDSFNDGQAAGLKACQILFVSYSEKSRIVRILSALKGADVLTVSEIEGFPLLGGDILFDQEGQKIDLVVNLEAARGAKLNISSRLLQVSKIYKVE
jgi:hypothetical protein